MKIKVCGMRERENVAQVAQLKPDYMGFIFYPPSPRNAISIDSGIFREVPKEIKSVGVFVNASEEEIIEKETLYKLSAVQLHGDESPDFCRQICNHGIEVWKAFSISKNAGKDFFNLLLPYIDIVDYFLFDTIGASPGGNGEKFKWEILNYYPYKKPYFLSGGIGPEDFPMFLKGLPPHCVGIDINSKFETKPGKKDLTKLSTFFSFLRNE